MWIRPRTFLLLIAIRSRGMELVWSDLGPSRPRAFPLLHVWIRPRTCPFLMASTSNKNYAKILDFGLVFLPRVGPPKYSQFCVVWFLRFFQPKTYSKARIPWGVFYANNSKEFNMWKYKMTNQHRGAIFVLGWFPRGPKSPWNRQGAGHTARAKC